MNYPLLYALFAAMVVILLAAGVNRIYRKRHPLVITHSELLAGLRKLKTVKPMASRIEGDPDWISPEKRKRKRKTAPKKHTVIEIVKRKTGTRE